MDGADCLIVVEDVHKAKRTCVTSACVHCSKRKIKCDGKFPCSNCSKRKITCTYHQKQKRGPKGFDRLISEIIENYKANNADGLSKLFSEPIGFTTNHQPSPPLFLDRSSLSLRFTLNQFLDSYNTTITTCLSVPTQTLDNLWSTDDQIRKLEIYTALAYGASSYGDEQQLKLFLGETRNMLKDLYDVMHPNIALANYCMSTVWFLQGNFEQARYYNNAAQAMANALRHAHRNALTSQWLESMNMVYINSAVVGLLQLEREEAVRTANSLLEEFKKIPNDDLWSSLSYQFTRRMQALLTNNLPGIIDAVNAMEDLGAKLKDLNLTGDKSRFEKEWNLWVKSHRIQLEIVLNNHEEATKRTHELHKELVPMVQSLPSILLLEIVSNLAILHKQTMSIHELATDIELLDKFAHLPLARLLTSEILSSFVEMGMDTIGNLNVKQYYSKAHNTNVLLCLFDSSCILGTEQSCPLAHGVQKPNWENSICSLDVDTMASLADAPDELSTFINLEDLNP